MLFHLRRSGLRAEKPSVTGQTIPILQRNITLGIYLIWLVNITAKYNLGIICLEKHTPGMQWHVITEAKMWW